MADPIVWTSASTWAAVLFVAAGLFQVLIGALTAGYVAFSGDGDAFLFTARSDTRAFGTAPTDMVDTYAGLHTYRIIVWLMLAGFLVAIGTLEAAVAWIPLRAGALWAAALLTAVAVVLIGYWFGILGVYTKAAWLVPFFDIPPFMWVPAALHVPAIVLAWSGLRGA